MEENIDNFTTSCKEESIEKILSTLKFISKIREGERIDVKTMVIVKQDIPSRLHRTLISRETRNETLDFLRKSINTAISVIYYYAKSDNIFDQDITKILIENLINSIIGIKNLTVTYEEDRKFVSDLETLMQTLETKIQQKKPLLKI